MVAGGRYGRSSCRTPHHVHGLYASMMLLEKLGMGRREKKTRGERGNLRAAFGGFRGRLVRGGGGGGGGVGEGVGRGEGFW